MTAVLDEFHERPRRGPAGVADDIRSSQARPPTAGHVRHPPAGTVAARLGDAAIENRPRHHRHRPAAPGANLHRPGRGQDRIEDRVATVIHESLDAGPESDGRSATLLVFPPRPWRDPPHRRAPSRGVGAEVVVHQLHGSVPAAEQDAALAQPAGPLSVVLATAIAETSITVDGVRIVIGSGRRRTLRAHAAPVCPG